MAGRADTPGPGFPMRWARALWHSELLRSFATIALVIVAVKGCVLDQYTVPSSSMHPTLQGNNSFLRDDRILVNKWVFGPRVPFTTLRLWRWGNPDRWDIVVFKSVDPDAEHDILVKRVVGLPGESISIAGGTLLVNGTPLEAPDAFRADLNYVAELNTPWREVMRAFVQFVAEDGPLAYFNPASPGVAELREDIEALRPKLLGIDAEALSFEEVEAYCANVHKESLNLIRELVNLQYPALQYGVLDDEAHRLVPEGHYFLLGDNGPVSLDGRVYGWVPHNHLFGPAFAIWWPVGRWRDFSGFSDTWWGKLLLYGIPAALVAFELRHFVLERKRKRRARA